MNKNEWENEEVTRDMTMSPDTLPTHSQSSCSHWMQSVLEVFGKWYLIGKLLAYLLPVPQAGSQVVGSGNCTQAWAGGGGRVT